MEKESLIICRDKILNAFKKINIEPLDKLELMVNVYYFLDPEEYEDNIKVLKKEKKDDIM